jgi:hypothetical protein
VGPRGHPENRSFIELEDARQVPAGEKDKRSAILGYDNPVPRVLIFTQNLGDGSLWCRWKLLMENRGGRLWSRRSVCARRKP